MPIRHTFSLARLAPTWASAGFSFIAAFCGSSAFRRTFIFFRNALPWRGSCSNQATRRSRPHFRQGFAIRVT